MTQEPTIVDATMEVTLANVVTGVPGLVGIILADEAGLPVVSSLPEDRGVAESTSMTAVAVEIGRRIASHLNLGDFENVSFSFDNRYLYVSSLAGGRAHILALASRSVNLSLLSVALEEIRKAFDKYMSDFLYLEP